MLMKLRNRIVPRCPIQNISQEDNPLPWSVWPAYDQSLGWRKPRGKSVFRNMTHLIFENHYNNEIPSAVMENNNIGRCSQSFFWRWLRWLSLKPRSDGEVESSVPASEKKVCQDRFHQKYGMSYLYESWSDIKLVALEGDDESFVPRKVGMERQKLKQTWWFWEWFLSWGCITE